MKHRYNRMQMTEGPLFINIILYTIPIILTGVLQLLFNAADLIVVGRYCGSISVGAVGATGSITNLIVNLFIGLSVGAGVTVAQALGSGNQQKAHNIVHTAIPSAVIGGIILTMVGVFGSEYLLGLMGTPSDVIKLSSLYMKIYFCGMTSNMLYNFGAAILRVSGDTKGPLYYLTIAGVINVILNVIFVYFFNMNVAGVALATVISQTLSAILVLLALMKKNDGCRLQLKKLRIHKKELGQIIHIGLPAGIQGSLFSISNVLIQSSINSFGSVVMSGNAATQNIEGFVYTSMNSFHQTALNFTGQNYGAKKYDRIKKIMWMSLLSVSVTGIIAGVSATVFSKPLLSIYITDSQEAIAYGVSRMFYVSLPYFLCGIMDVMTGTLRGLGASIGPMIITVLGVCGFRVAWIFLIFSREQFHSLPVLYISYPISWVVTFIAELITFFVIYNRIKNQKDCSA